MADVDTATAHKPPLPVIHPHVSFINPVYGRVQKYGHDSSHCRHYCSHMSHSHNHLSAHTPGRAQSQLQVIQLIPYPGNYVIQFCIELSDTFNSRTSMESDSCLTELTAVANAAMAGKNRVCGSLKGLADFPAARMYGDFRSTNWLDAEVLSLPARNHLTLVRTTVHACRVPMCRSHKWTYHWLPVSSLRLTTICVPAPSLGNKEILNKKNLP